MKAEFLTENIELFIPLLSKILPLHSQVPILSNILIEAHDDGILMYATNLEVGVRVKIPGKITEKGAITVPGKQLLEALSSFPKDKVVLQNDGDKMVIEGRGDRIVFQTIPKEEFPSIFEERGEKLHVFKGKEFKDIFSSLVFAASLDEGRPELTGILMSQKDNGADFVATDGFRLSLRRVEALNIPFTESLILPAKLIIEALTHDADELAMYVYKKSNQLIFESDNVTLVGRLIAGTFPNYEKVIPKSGKTKITLDVEEFSQKLRLVSIFARDAANIVKAKILDGKLIMQARASGVGEGEMVMEGQQEGESNEIAFNIKFLNDFLKNISAKSITLQVSSPVEPAVFKADNDISLTHVIMPVRVQE